MTVGDDELALRRQRVTALFTTLSERPTQPFYAYFPDEGHLRRQLYPKHMELFAAGAYFPERLFMAANRVGKSDAGGIETAFHLTGLYPRWWRGHRFTHPIEAWACGTTGETTRDIVQAKLLGPWDNTNAAQGFLPRHLVLSKTPRPHGIRGSLEGITVQHVTGGKSRLNFKTYEQGRKNFEGTSKDWVWDDEEPPVDVYQEQVLRTLTTGGLVLVTFTPLQGMSEVVQGFVEATEEQQEVKFFVQAGWDDVPHLNDDYKRRQLATMLPYQIAARTKGEPSLGSGAIFPIPESDITIPARAIPNTWLRGYGMDVGWNRTAAMFVAQDPGNGQYVVYDIHYMSVGEPSSHATAIRARGEYLEGVIDPAARGRSQHDGKQLIQSYRDLGLNLHVADNSVETGITEMWTLFISGMLKVTANCEDFFREFRKYHRDEKGQIVKTNDHAIDALRYFLRSGRDRMRLPPRTKPSFKDPQQVPLGDGKSWMST